MPTASKPIKAPTPSLPFTSKPLLLFFHFNVSLLSLVFYYSTERERASHLVFQHPESENTAMEPWKMILPCLLLILIFLATDLVRPTHAIWLNIPSSGTKCVSEEIQTNVVVMADYVVISENYTHTPTISVKVSPRSVNARVFLGFFIFFLVVFGLIEYRIL